MYIFKKCSYTDDLTYMWNPMNKITDRQNRNRGTDMSKRLTAVRGEEGTGWKKVKGSGKDDIWLTQGPRGRSVDGQREGGLGRGGQNGGKWGHL